MAISPLAGNSAKDAPDSVILELGGVFLVGAVI